MGNKNRFILLDKEVVRVDLETWRKWQGATGGFVLHRTERPHDVVSTVFTGIPRYNDQGKLFLFETKIIGGLVDGDCFYTENYGDAKKCHELIIHFIESQPPNPETDPETDPEICEGCTKTQQYCKC